MSLSDAELLQQYVRQRSDDAFRQIVMRYESLVRGCAARQLQRLNLVDDVAQAVFIILARRAGQVAEPSLAAWLITTTRYCARDALRLHTRRLRHEQQAATMRAEPATADAAQGVELADYIDAALSTLSERDASALALRYLQNKPVDEVAQTLGVTPDAAGKIISRAITKLRDLLTRRGVKNVGASSMSALAIPPSASFVEAAVRSALTPNDGSFCLQIANTTQAWMRRSATLMTTTAVSAAVVLLAAAGGTGYALWPDRAAPATESGAQVIELPLAFRPPASAMPFGSPFIEMVGCRIKQIARVPVDGRPAAPLQWYENQAVQIEWDAAALPAGATGPIEVRIVRADTPPDAPPLWSRQVGASVSAVSYSQADPALPSNWLPAGDYRIEIARAGRPLGAVSVRVEPTPDGVLDFIDVPAEGPSTFTQIGQFISSSPTPLTSGSLYLDPKIKAGAMVGDDLEPMPHKLEKPGQIRFYHSPPVQPGEAILWSVSGTNPVYPSRHQDVCVVTVMVGSRTKKVTPCRRVTLIRLPAGAEEISVSGTDQYRVVDGRMQVFHDTLVSPWDVRRLSVRYRLAAPAITNKGKSS